ncbi:hypothetical protein G6F35_012438 [Rhizopus arrhizus]|nr:hypothetical protein G6F35_012438 [Rhizopus arrhizus]
MKSGMRSIGSDTSCFKCGPSARWASEISSRSFHSAAFQRRADHVFQQRRQARLVRRIGQLHQHIGRVALIERLLHPFRMRQHQVQAIARKVFERLQPRAALFKQDLEQLQRLRGRLHGGEHHRTHIGAREQAQRHRRDHAQRAFGADQQLLQVVAGVVFAQRAQAVEDLARGQHGLQAQHQFARHAVAHHVHAAGVGGDVAADLAGVFRRQAQRQQAPGVLRRAAQVAQDGAGFGHHRVGYRVDGTHGVHAVQAKHHVFRAAIRRGATAQAGIAAARHHRHALLLAQGQAGGDLRSGARTHDGLRVAVTVSGPRAWVRR